MAIEQRTDYPAVEHPRKRLMVRFRVPYGNDFVAFGKAIHMKSFLIRRPAAEADAVWGEFLL